MRHARGRKARDFQALIGPNEKTGTLAISKQPVDAHRCQERLTFNLKFSVRNRTDSTQSRMVLINDCMFRIKDLRGFKNAVSYFETLHRSARPQDQR